VVPHLPAQAAARTQQPHALADDLLLLREPVVEAATRPRSYTL
jgi:hypothetical protein